MTLGSHVDCIESESSCPRTICNMPDVLVAQVLGTPTREEIKCMNPNYTEFKFPQIKAHPWHKVCNFLILSASEACVLLMKCVTLCIENLERVCLYSASLCSAFT
jgi:hypothetical protein